MKLLNIFNPIIDIILKFILRYSQSITFDKIKIIDFQKSDYEIEKSLFENSLISSLELIKKLDNPNYKKINKEIKWIIQSKRLFKNKYIENHKLYSIKYIQHWNNQQLVDIYNAGTLIDFISYQCLISKYKKATNIQQEKINNICLLKEKRFYKKVEKLYPQYKGLLINQFIA